MAVPTAELRLTMLHPGPGFYFATAAFVLVGLSWCRKYWNNRSHLPLPPGPPALPIVGSIFSLKDRERAWLSFDAWRSTYGDIIYARMLNKRIVVVNSEEIARDLFDKRSFIYSDKPRSIVYEPFATDFNIAVMPYGDRWRLHRRIFHQPLRQAAIPTYHPVQVRSAHKMLSSLLQDPKDYSTHLQMFTFSIILSVVYDHEPKSKDDAVVGMMQRFLEATVGSLTPGATVILEAFPFLLRLPTWFPGASYKRASVRCLETGREVKEIPFQKIRESMSNGKMTPCLVTDAMTKMNGFDDDVVETAIKEAACIAFGAAGETTTSTLRAFILAMMIHPEIQAKAQAEIDRVVGKDRLPDFEDRPALPYVDAILRETLRWYPVLRLGVPHATTTSDIYNGYYIPEGVVVIANTWAMTRNEKKYPNPDEFKPERFLHEDGSLTSDTMVLAFGWGRRICVGQYLADASLWIAVVSLLSTFSFRNALDENGKEIPATMHLPTGMISRPDEFLCRIVPRFSGASETLAKLAGLDDEF